MSEVSFGRLSRGCRPPCLLQEVRELWVVSGKGLETKAPAWALNLPPGDRNNGNHGFVGPEAQRVMILVNRHTAQNASPSGWSRCSRKIASEPIPVVTMEGQLGGNHLGSAISFRGMSK